MSAQESPPASAQAWYQAEYDFYRKIIEDEVARLRWNGGFEPLDCDLYFDPGARYPTWLGRTRINHRDFLVRVTSEFDPEGRKILRLSIRTQQRN